MLNSFIINGKDDVVTVTEPIQKGAQVSFELGQEIVSIPAVTDIPKYHKMAIHPVKKHDVVLKYGEVIGRATQDIQVGEHVHTQNLEDLPREEG